MIEVEGKKKKQKHESCLGNFIFSLENSKLAVASKERSVLLKLLSRKKKQVISLCNVEMLHMVFSTKKKRFGKGFLLQNVGFCILNRKETYLTSPLLQEPFEIFHASGFWPNLFSTAGKHLQLLVYVALTDLWILLDKVCVAFHLNIKKQYALIDINLCVYFFCYPFLSFLKTTILGSVWNGKIKFVPWKFRWCHEIKNSLWVEYFT